MVRLLLLCLGYCFGLFQTGYLYGKWHGIDIRSKGSGNSGATNSLRVLGKKAGIVVFLGDALKCHIPAAFTVLYFRHVQPDHTYLYMMYIALGAILGHNFPFYMGFKGGKGISCMGGLVAAYDWRLMVLCLLEMIGLTAITGYVSVASIVLSVTIFLFSLIMGETGRLGLENDLLTEFYILCFVLSALAIWQHRGNINRLLHGTENKIWKKKEQKEGASA